MGALVAQIIRSRWVPLIFLAGVLVLAVNPAHTGPHTLSVTRIVPPCGFKRITGLPCPACGLTRSLICVAHGDIGEAIILNPVGLLLFPAFAALGLAALIPAQVRERAAGWVERRYLLFNAAGIGVGVALLVNGVGRILWIVYGRHPSVW